MVWLRYRSFFDCVWLSLDR